MCLSKQAYNGLKLIVQAIVIWHYTHARKLSHIAHVRKLSDTTHTQGIVIRTLKKWLLQRIEHYKKNLTTSLKYRAKANVFPIYFQ